MKVLKIELLIHLNQDLNKTIQHTALLDWEILQETKKDTMNILKIVALYKNEFFLENNIKNISNIEKNLTEASCGNCSKFKVLSISHWAY